MFSVVSRSTCRTLALAVCILGRPVVSFSQDQYLVGDWNGNGKDNIAVRIGNRILMDTDGDGVPDKEQRFGNGNSEDEYLVGDWNNDGADHIAVRRGNRIVMDTNFDETPDREVVFGSGARDSQYLVGDWNGNGSSDFAVRRRNRITLDAARDAGPGKEYTFGRGNDTHYLIGDWDGDGSSNFAVRRGNAVFMDTNFDTKVDIQQTYGDGDSESEYLVGDWDGDGKDNLAVRRGNRILMDTNFDAKPDIELTFVFDPGVADRSVATEPKTETVRADTITSGNDVLKGGQGGDQIIGDAKTMETEVTSGVPTTPSAPTETPVDTEEMTPAHEATPPPDEDTRVAQGTVTITGQPAPAPTPTPQPTVQPGSETINVSTLNVTGFKVDSVAGVAYSITEPGGQTLLFSSVLPQGTNYVGSDVTGNRQEQVLLRLYGLPLGAYPMLEAAARRHLIKETGSATDAEVAQYLKSLYDNPDGRLGLAPSLLIEGVTAILADERNAWQDAFYGGFAAYSGALQYRAVSALYKSWKWYRGETVDGINPIVEYKPAGLGVLLDTGKKLSDFRPPSSALDIGPAGLLAAVDIYGSGVGPIIGVPPINEEIDPSDLEDLAGLAGLGGPVMLLALGKQFTDNFQDVVLRIAERTAETKSTIKANDIENMYRDKWLRVKGQNPDTPPFEEFVKQEEAKFAAKKTAQEGAENAAEQASKRLSKELSEEIIEAGTKRGAREIASAFAERLAAKISAKVIAVLGRTGAAVAGGFLMGAPAIIDVVLAIVEFAETEKFDAEITDAYNAGPNLSPDLKAMIAPNREFQDGLCYQWCKAGYSGLATLCYKDCPSGYRTDPATCVRDPSTIEKERYYRGQTAMTCAPGQEQDGGLCYQQCQSGYHGIATICYQWDCPSGFRDDGLYCAKPGPYSREGFAWQIGDPPLPNYSGPIGRCEAKYGGGNCEQWGALIYPKCKANYHADGCCVCSPDCPGGWQDIGVSCKKPSYDRGVGTALNSCPAEHEQIGALCYPLCKEGFTGSLDWCIKNDCPEGYRNDPLTCFRDAQVFGRESYDRGVGFVAATQESCVSDDKRISNIAAIIGHMTKMMVTDAADAGILVMPGDQISPVAPQMMGITVYY
ncbi:MAG: hypothetical protein WBW88_05215 [Rhodothermales bacterium]